MSVETIIGLPDQFAIESLLAAARFISGHKQNRLTFHIEGEGDSPFATTGAEPKFLHIRVA